MTPRQRALTALRRQIPDRVPKFADFSPGIYDTFITQTGVKPPPRSPWAAWTSRPVVTFEDDIGLSDPAEYFHYDARIVELGDTQLAYDFSAYLPNDLPMERTRIGEWGVAWVRGSVHHFQSMVHPLANATTLDEIEKFPFPDVTAEYRRAVARRRIAQVHAKDCASVGWIPMVGGTFFETAWRLRGLENLLIDLQANQELAACLLARVGALTFANCCFFAEAGVDILLTGDDFGSQDRMLMSPAMWRKWFKPRYADLIARVKAIKPSILIFYHSDGYIEPIIPELIEIGIDILNPVQPECMDPAKIKQRFGERLAFWGTIGTQTTFPFSTPDQVKARVKETIETVGRGGGLLIAPTHKLEPDVPWENIVAFFDAVEEYGAYC